MKQISYIAAMASLAMACSGGEYVDDDSEIGQTEQSWTIRYRPGRIMGTQLSGAQCTTTQSASTQCYAVKPIYNPEDQFPRYTIWMHEGVDGFGPTDRTEMQAAVNSLSAYVTSYEQPPLPLASFSLAPTSADPAGAQCRFYKTAYDGIPNTTSPTAVQNFLGYGFANTGTALPESPSRNGSWYLAEYASIFVDANLGTGPGGPGIAQVRKQLFASGILGCIGLGRQGSNSTSYTFNYLQASVTNVNDRWGSNTCEERRTFWGSDPGSTMGGWINVLFDGPGSGACVTP